MPAKKHQVAGDGFFRIRLTTAMRRLKNPATNGRKKKSLIR